MQKIILKYSLLLFVGLVISHSALAQKMNNTLYLMQNVPQSNQLNPAIQPEAKIFIGFPALSSIYFNYSNSSFSYKDIIKPGTGLQKDSLVFDINSFHNALQPTNTISSQLDYTFFSLGIRAKKMFFTLDMSSKVDARFGFDKELISFLRYGNGAYMGQTANLGAFELEGTSYHEIALGASKEITDKLTIGVKAKALLGIANMHMDKSNISVFTSESGDLVRLQSKQLMRVSAPITITEKVGDDGTNYIDDIDFVDDPDANFFSGKDNIGFALDLGATYQFSDKIALYASILDLGGIKWKGTYELYQDASFDWAGGDWSQSGNSNDPNYREIKDVMDDLTDSISNAFKFRDNTGSSYSKALPTKLYLGGSYKLNDYLNFGAVSRSEIYDGHFRPSLTLSANTRIARHFSASLSYSMVNNSYNNVGIGLASRLGPLQVYAVSDNILAIHPNTAQLANFRFGINMLFGTKDKKQKDVCDCD